MCGNRIRKGSDRKLETGKTRSLKLALFKNPIDAAHVVTYYHADMHVFIESAQRTPTRQAISATPSLNAVLIIRVIIDSKCSALYMYCTLSIEIFKSATFGERIRRVWGLLSRPFLTRFPRTRCYI